VKRILIVALLQLAALAAGAAAIIVFFLDHLLQPTRDATAMAFFVACGAMAGLTAAVVAVAIRRRASASPTPLLAAMMIATALAGFIPAAVDGYARQQEFAARRAEDRGFEQDFLSGLAQREREVAARIADHRAFTPDEALDLVFFVESDDLRYRSLPDHSREAMALLAQALDGGLFDPNGEVEPDRRRKPGAKPIFLYYYDVRVINHEARPQEWAILAMLVAHGADLGRAEAIPLTDDLAKRR
jgi:hypothetical protein